MHGMACNPNLSPISWFLMGEPEHGEQYQTGSYHPIPYDIARHHVVSCHILAVHMHACRLCWYLALRVRAVLPGALLTYVLHVPSAAVSHSPRAGRGRHRRRCHGRRQRGGGSSPQGGGALRHGDEGGAHPRLCAAGHHEPVAARGVPHAQ